MKNKDRTYYFGFDSAMDHPDWANGISTSLNKERVQKSWELDYKNPFAPRLKRQLKKFEKQVNIGFEFHTVYVAKGKAIRPLITKVAKALIEAGWQLGDFNKNMRVYELWSDSQDKKESTKSRTIFEK